MALILTFLSGVLFALGLGISGMTNPTKVSNFLNVAGNWDPSLAFVMIGAVLVYLAGQTLILRRSGPVYGSSFQLPKGRTIDSQLLFGAALFGVGWGMIGLCPGPALVAAVTGVKPVLVFLVSMGLGMYAFDRIKFRLQRAPDEGTFTD